MEPQLKHRKHQYLRCIFEGNLKLGSLLDEQNRPLRRCFVRVTPLHTMYEGVEGRGGFEPPVLFK